MVMCKNFANFNGFKSKIIYSVAGICQTLALILHFFLLGELEDVCTSTQTENSRAHITASIVLGTYAATLSFSFNPILLK